MPATGGLFLGASLDSLKGTGGKLPASHCCLGLQVHVWLCPASIAWARQHARQGLVQFLGWCCTLQVFAAMLEIAISPPLLAEVRTA